MVRLTDRPDMTLDVYRGSKTTIQCNATITPHLKSTKNLNRKAAFGRPAIKITGGGGGGGVEGVDQPSPLGLTWFLRHLVVWFAWKIPNS